MMLPLWDARYFDWQLLSERPGGRDFLVAAYDGTKLVGSLLGEKFRFRLHDQEFDATMGSWLTVDPEYRRQGVGIKLFDEQHRRHLEHDVKFHLGYGYTGADEHGSQVLEELSGQHRRIGTRRLLGTDVRSAAGFTLGLDSARSAGVENPWPIPKPASAPRFTGVYRRYRPEDLGDCLQLAHRLLDRVDMGYVWSADRLAHQLAGSDMPRTLVAERDGRVVGFVNWYLIDFLGRYPLPGAMVDLMAFGSMSLSESKDLIRAALDQIVQEGAKFALALRLPCYPFMPLAQTGWITMPRDFSLICVRMDTSFPLDGRDDCMCTGVKDVCSQSGSDKVAYSGGVSVARTPD